MRVPSIACTAKELDRLLCWMHIPEIRYETVDWEHATLEEMEQWRQEFSKMKSVQWRETQR